MNATAIDYRWLDEDCPELIEAYCLTLVRGIDPKALLTRLGAVDQDIRITGAVSIVETAHEAWDGGRSQFVGVTAVCNWALMIEPNGYLGTLDEVSAPLSQGSEVVSHFCNVNAADHFSWFVDGELRLRFEPLFPHARDGVDPDGAVDAMREAGFDLREAEDQGFAWTTEAAFAFAERLTGVRLTPELLAHAEFVCAKVPIPGR